MAQNLQKPSVEKVEHKSKHFFHYYIGGLTKKFPDAFFFNTFWQHCSDETSRGVIVDCLLLSVKISTL